MAFGVEEQVAGFQVAVEQVAGVHVLETLKHLVDYVLLVDILENVRPNHRVQIRVHEVKHQVYVPVILGPYHVLESDNVLMAVQLLQEDYLTESPLSVCSVLERIEVLLKRHYILRFLVDRFPNYPIGSLTYKSNIHYYVKSWLWVCYLVSGEFRISLARGLRVPLSFSNSLLF